MNKYAFNLGMPIFRLPYKLLLAMKLTILLMTTVLLQVSAASFGQRVTLSVKKAPLETMFQKLREQTGHDFIFDAKIVGSLAPVSIQMKDVSLTDALNSLLANQPLSYEINDRAVIIRKKDPSIIGELISRLQAVDLPGTIRDQKGMPMAGATVAIKGKSQTLRTNLKGEFLISNIEPNDIVVISFVGYLTQEIAVTDRKRLDIVMLEDVAALGEVSISTGYQSIKSAKLTGAISSVGAQDLEKRNATNILANLEGRIPGLVYYNNTATIRGIGTLNANRSILVVVDGFPIEGSIANINPYDIESVSVLKDAAAAAIYGARASNGVLVVTTKKAKTKGKTLVEFSSNLSYFEKPDYSGNNYMSPSEQVGMESDYYNYWFNSNPAGNTARMVQTFESNIQTGLYVTPVQYAYYQLAKGQINATGLQGILDGYRQNNFVEDYKNNALTNQFIQQYDLSARTAGERSQSSLVVNYKTDNSGIINAYNRQLNIFFKGTYNLAKWIDVDYGVNTIIGKARTHNNTRATTPFNVPSYMSLFDANGDRARYSLSDFNSYSTNNTVFESTSNLYSVKFNHLDELERDFNTTTLKNSRYYVSLNIKPLKGLSIRPQFQYEDNNTESSAYSEKNSYTMRHLQNTFTTRITTGTGYRNLLPAGGKLETTRTISPSYTARLQGNYDREFGKHAISLIAGTEFRETRSNLKGNAFFGYDDQLQVQSNTALVYETLRTLTSAFWSTGVSPSVYYGSAINRFRTSDVLHRYASGYANMTYTYNGKYNAFGSFRKDYADLFGGDSKYRGRPLWSAGASWILSEEDFIKNIKVFDYLKLRTSFGVTGNIAMDYTAQLTANVAGTNVVTNAPVATVTNPPNPKLRWEKTSTNNLGIDFALFNQRLKGNFDFYSKKGTDLLAVKRLDATLGFTTLVINNGDMENKGLELGLNYEWIRADKDRGLSLNSALVVSKNTNKITSVDEIVTTPAALAGSGAFRIGRPVNSLYSYQFRGLNATGLPQWMLSNGSLTTASIPSTDINAVIFSGGVDPTVSMSLNNEISYKGLSLNIFTVYYGGHFLRDNAPSLYDDPEYSSMSATILDSWTPSNTNTIVPGFGQYYQAAANANPLVYGDAWVKRADFFKIRTIVLGYQLPTSIARKIGTSNIRFRFQIDNPNITWTSDKLIVDPESRGLRRPTAYVLGANINF